VKLYLLSRVPGGDAGSGDSFSPSIGETGGNIRIAFSSDASGLLAGDTNDDRDIFITEFNPTTEVQTISRVSISSDGTQGNNLSTAPVLSANGTIVAFTSYANNLVFNDTNINCTYFGTVINRPDIFARDLTHDVTWRVSLTNEGLQAQSNSGAAQLDGDGRYASFTTHAQLTGDGSAGSFQQVFVRDQGAPAGNPIISPSFWVFFGVPLDGSSTWQFTISFSGNLDIGTISVVDATRFSIEDDTCSGGSFVDEDTCNFTVRYAPSSGLDDDNGDTHTTNIVVPVSDDRGELYVGIEGNVGAMFFTPYLIGD
jgi:hypothetical protein